MLALPGHLFLCKGRFDFGKASRRITTVQDSPWSRQRQGQDEVAGCAGLGY